MWQFNNLCDLVNFYSLHFLYIKFNFSFDIIDSESDIEFHEIIALYNLRSFRFCLGI